ncbi:ABC transporter ATP-binding protein [Alkalihalophilus marmarensis]|uniref:Spermidine/putrescine ABC transporter ATP-binding protein n=1 Tax=Alkalihalophilus marmarensis DSM 21297 TaxID=1188261 RepID=U6SL09_9BACI|nr:ABC transporter ATP-binding protein [Alkalihalophilus marmarensis]ERN52389.1 spermidine/putrescine ABC transporter ATP-binding protein [Alkalihalophilus marmarensis DSM 21297]
MVNLRVDDVSLTYLSKSDATKALVDIHFSVEDGEFISILGPSGCGKTTLLSLVAGILKPTSGTVTLDGIPTSSKQANIGYMLQQDYLFPWLSIESNIMLGQKILGMDKPQSKDLALSLLEKVGLLDKLTHYPAQLSGGMRQRVALVRMMATNPSLLLLDEPFSALDYQTKLKLEDLVATILKEEQKTAILVTHDIGEAIAMSDRVILLSARPGRIAKIFDIPKEIRGVLPFEARQLSSYTELFNEIWKELESLETNKG